MKRTGKRFVALFLAMLMVLTTVSSVWASPQEEPSEEQVVTAEDETAEVQEPADPQSAEQHAVAETAEPQQEIVTETVEPDQEIVAEEAETQVFEVNTSIRTDLTSSWPNFRGNDENNAVVDVATPNAPDNAALYWALKTGEGYDSRAVGSPILVDGNLIYTAGTTLYKVDKTTGTILESTTMTTSSDYNIIPPTYAAGMIFVALKEGQIQAFNADTLESLWIYKDALGGQCNTVMTYKNGCIYVGFWNAEDRDANFACVPVVDEDANQTAESKAAKWTYKQKGGFYWAGAYAGADFVVVGTDDGNMDYSAQSSSILSFDPETGEVLDRFDGLNGDIRSAIAYDTVTDAYYCTSKGGSFYQFKVGADGKFTENSLCEIALGGSSTSTPVIYNGRAYVGVSGSSQFNKYSGHCIAVIDLSSFSIAYKATTMGYPQTSGLLSTAYEAETGYVYVYFMDNYTPGQVRYIKDRAGQTELVDGVVENNNTCAPVLFTPLGGQAQYALCSPIVDEDGTLYFKNDSGYMMALGSKITSLEVVKGPDKTSYASGETFDPAGMQVVAHMANGVQKDVTDLITVPTKALTGDDVTVTISYNYVMYNDVDGKNLKKPAAEISVSVKSDAARNVEGLISAIGTVSLNSKAAIDTARAAYNGLSAIDKLDVTNYETLAAAERVYGDLAAAVTNVENLIRAIGNVTANSQNAIAAAQGAYNALNNEQKAAVSNIATLTAAQNSYNALVSSYRWKHNSKGWWYEAGDGSYVQNAWKQITGKWYYFGSNGYMATGWINLGGKWYYMGSAGDGARKTGWNQLGGKWYYMNGDGVMATGWTQVGSTWYYLQSSGAMLTGWQNLGGAWYYLRSSGAMATGWQNLGGTWYYLRASGAMATGWTQVGSTWYYLRSSGAMVTGWQNLGGAWYYLRSSGAMATGWLNLGGTWYYLRSSGAMATGWLDLGGTWYYLRSSGAMVTGWQQVGSSWYYLYGDGHMAANTRIGNYYVNASGAWVR